VKGESLVVALFLNTAILLLLDGAFIWAGIEIGAPKSIIKNTLAGWVVIACAACLIKLLPGAIYPHFVRSNTLRIKRDGGGIRILRWG
jgi:hypothetical protein